VQASRRLEVHSPSGRRIGTIYLLSNRDRLDKTLD